MKAVFLDRDGVMNPLIYYEEQGIVDSPFKAEQLTLYPWTAQSVNRLHDLGYKVIVASNQPGIAKGYLTEASFARIRRKLQAELARGGASVDDERYCHHHPDAIVEKLRVSCGCRKPKAGLLLQAAKDLGIDLSASWMVGDGITDIQAGKGAGCRTVLIGRIKCELCQLMDEKDARPDAVRPNLKEAVDFIAGAEVS